MSQSQQGEANPSAKLTEQQVRDIRQFHDDGVSLRELADDYDISHATVWLIVQRRTWADL